MNNKKPIALIDTALTNLNSYLDNIRFSFEEENDKFIIVRKNIRVREEFYRPIRYTFNNLTEVLNWISAVKVGVYASQTDI